MRILTAGLEDKRAKPFWAQQPITCPNCSCTFEMDEDDSHMIIVSELDAVQVLCPHCDNLLNVVNPGVVSTELQKERTGHDETVVLYNEALVRISELENQLHELHTNN